MTPLIRRLDLRAPIRAEGEDRLTAYDLKESIAYTPDADIAAVEAALLNGVPTETIPAGRYLFAQAPGDADERTVAEEALEMQKEGLWKGESLGGRLYLRVLAEERGKVRQLLRQLKE